MILITGTGRSGSKYLSRRLRDAGLDVRHERAGRHGAVSSLWLHEAPWYPAYHAQHRPHFALTFLQVREPLACIGSLTTTGDASWHWMHEVLGIPMLPLVDRCAYWYVYQNTMALSVCDGWWRVERVLGENRGVNSRPHRTVTWDDIGDVQLRRATQELSRRLGYEET